MRRRDEPEMAAAKCSDTQDFAVPGTPSKSNARSVASVATAVSISRRLPTYFGVIGVLSAALPPSGYVTTARGESFQLAGRSCSSDLASAESSAAKMSSADWRSMAVIGGSPLEGRQHHAASMWSSSDSAP